MPGRDIVITTSRTAVEDGVLQEPHPCALASLTGLTSLHRRDPDVPGDVGPLCFNLVYEPGDPSAGGALPPGALQVAPGRRRGGGDGAASAAAVRRERLSLELELVPTEQSSEPSVDGSGREEEANNDDGDEDGDDDSDEDEDADE
ncbi:hypothetical protein GPECTOR_6g584 [Gonium pectorale]|uniref:Uncharacterized protein n=1 Tax=Gonium pectorale TaxID=33097 RepID=A0A150GUW4_GONPE|nr:hypothetical protein GPECTOR_6g584 [Gonium pectorale]|eukprot:KXZ53667.1 hypothetical protein GPECTOR_6g584 [Gonium pectorale]